MGKYIRTYIGLPMWSYRKLTKTKDHLTGFTLVPGHTRMYKHVFGEIGLSMKRFIALRALERFFTNVESHVVDAVVVVGEGASAELTFKRLLFGRQMNLEVKHKMGLGLETFAALLALEIFLYQVATRPYKEKRQSRVKYTPRLNFILLDKREVSK